MAFKEKRAPFKAEEQKFSTQRVVTYALLIIFAAVTAYVFYGDDQAERSTVLQTVINFTMLAIGFWLGSSKGSADKEAELQQIRKAETPQASDTTTVGAAKETVAAAKETVAVAEKESQ